MAARQLLPDRRADPHRQAAPAARLQPRAAAPASTAPSAGCRASTTSRSRRSRTATAASTPRACAASSPPTRRVTPLQLGELWAIPIMLRLALIENLRRVGVARRRRAQPSATAPTRWADAMIEIAEQRSEEPDPRHRRHGALGPADGERVRRRVRAPPAGPERGAGAAAHLDRAAAGRAGQTIEQLVQARDQKQAADQVSIGNSIGSLRFLGAIDWREFVEALSVVEQMLRDDPAASTRAMDFATRDRYRHAVETIARREPMPSRGRRKALELARGSASRARRRRRARATSATSWSTTAAGSSSARVGARPSLAGRSRRAGRRHVAAARTCGAIALVAGCRSPPCWGIARRADARRMDAGRARPACCAARDEPARGRARQLARDAAGARRSRCRGMDFSRRHPAELAHAGRRADACSPARRRSSELLEALEVRFLANRDAHLHFALLTDFRDARAGDAAGDEALLAARRARGIDALNRKYAHAGRGDALLPVPSRRGAGTRASASGWAASASAASSRDLNALLRGDAARALRRDRRRHRAAARRALRHHARHRHAAAARRGARSWSATMAHPLNRPRFDASARRASSRATASCSRASASACRARAARATRACSAASRASIPYTRAVSDVYQDLFGEGSFIGKGIYDVDAFERALGGRFPENRILSHDLLEGCYARSGLLSDVELFEDYPSRYSADVEPPPPLDPRRLADRALAAARACPRLAARARAIRCRRCRAGRSSTTCAAASCRSRCRAAAARLDRAGAAGLLDARRARRSCSCPPLVDVALELLRKPDGRAAAPAPRRRSRARRRAAPRAGRCSRSPACRTRRCFSLDAIVRTLARMLVTRRRLLRVDGRRATRDAREPRPACGVVAAMWIAPALALGRAGVLTLARRARCCRPRRVLAAVARSRRASRGG